MLSISSRSVRALATVTLAGAAVLGGTAAAMASPAGHATAVTLTAHSDHAKVKAWEEFHITGAAAPADRGAVVKLQRRAGTSWVDVGSARTVERRDGHYTLRVELGRKGLNRLRTYKPAGHGQAAAASGEVDVTVG